MTPEQVDLNLLCILEALHAEGSASGAARRLNVSQPTLSGGLAKLRSYFRDPLFVRSGAGMKPTSFAMGLREPVQQLLAIARREVIPKETFIPSQTKRTFTITTSDIGELCFLPSLIEAFQSRAPHASLSCVSLPPGDLQRAIAIGEVDVATGYFPDLYTSDLQRQLLFNHPFVCIARRKHPFIRPPLTLEAFLSASHAVVRAKGRSQELVERTMQELGLQRRILLQSPHFMSLPVLVATTDLVSLVPRAVATSFANLPGLQMLSPPLELPEIPIAQHWSRRSQSDPAVVWLTGLIGELFHGRDPTQQ